MSRTEWPQCGIELCGVVARVVAHFGKEEELRRMVKGLVELTRSQ
ncbi:hypothetical protein [Candidatus Methylomirabilis sp.]